MSVDEALPRRHGAWKIDVADNVEGETSEQEGFRA
jgi:hypothetical protein